MKPRTLSATALNVASLCLARYQAEHINRSKGPGGTAASLGTSVHGALEMYVKTVVLEKKAEPSLPYLLDLFKMSYMTTFGTSDISTDDFADGVEMLQRWFKRNETYFSEVQVISCEVKENFPIKTSIGDIPFNFIWDRHDQIGDHEYKVVDYKTNRWGINPDDLKKKIQARAYGLAAQIKHPDAERIWVEFDMLRHDGPVGIVFSREENAATWKFMKAEAERIIATPDDDVPETLNPECNFCVRKQTCGALRKNISVGGFASISSAAEAVDTRALLEFQKKAIESAIKELDSVILAQAKAEDLTEFESENYKMEIGVSSRRAVEADNVERVIGPKLFEKYGGKSFSVTNLDKLLKGNEIDDATKSQLRGLVYRKFGEPGVKVSTKNPIDD